MKTDKIRWIRQIADADLSDRPSSLMQTVLRSDASARYDLFGQRLGESGRKKGMVGVDRTCPVESSWSGVWTFLVVLLAFVFSIAQVASAEDVPTVEETLVRAEAAFAERYVEATMCNAIEQYEEILAVLDTSDPERRAHTLNRLAQLCYEATTFSPGDTEEDRLWFERGKTFGLQSLRMHADFARLEGEAFGEAVACITDPAALLWTANNWGGLCGMNPIEGLLQSGKVRLLYERCISVDETCWGASAHNALGAMRMVAPQALGGDPQAAAQHLEAAIALAPDYLINRVVRAQYVGFSYDFFGQVSGVRDAGFIEQEMGFVLAADIGAWPFWNREAKKEAESLLAKLAEMMK